MKAHITKHEDSTVYHIFAGEIIAYPVTKLEVPDDLLAEYYTVLIQWHTIQKKLKNIKEKGD